MSVNKIIKELKDNKEVLPCTVDRVFKSVLSDKEMEGILSYLIVQITKLTEEEVYGNIEIVNPYEPVSSIKSKENTHDLKVEVKENSILLEMNNQNRKSTKFRNSAHFHEGIVKKLERAKKI